MPLFRQTYRLSFAVLLLVGGVLLIRSALLVDRARGRSWQAGIARRAQARWCHWLSSLLGVRMRVEGVPLAEGPVLVAANHISWLDIPCVAAHWPLAFLSKSEVRRWPLIGAVASGLGTLYIERGQRDAAAAAASAIRERLTAGHSVLFFPEGTTSDGSGLLPFRPRLFQAAIDSGALVQPLAISFHRLDGQISREAAFVNNDPLLSHVLRLAREPGLEVRLRLGPPIAAEGLGRTELSKRCQAAIETALERRPVVAGPAAAALRQAS